MSSLKSFTTTSAVAFFGVVLLFGPLSDIAQAHEWTVDVKGKETKVEAKIVGFDGKEVQLEADNGVRKTFSIDDLNDVDLAYLKDYVVTRETAVQENLGKQQLKQLENQAKSQYEDVWQVQLIAPNGERTTRKYYARNSADASAQAIQEFPNARVGAQRLLTNGFRGGLGLGSRSLGGVVPYTVPYYQTGGFFRF